MIAIIKGDTIYTWNNLVVRCFSLLFEVFGECLRLILDPLHVFERHLIDLGFALPLHPRYQVHHHGRLIGPLDYYDLEAAYFEPLLDLLHYVLRRHPQFDRLQLGQLREPRDPVACRSHHAVPRARPPG